MRISNILHTSKSCHCLWWLPYLSNILYGLCFSLYIGAAHYSILQFRVFVYPLAYMFCLHYVLQVASLQALDGPTSQPCWALHLRIMLQFGYIINCLSLPCSAVSSFWCNGSYTFVDSKFRVIFAFSWSWNLCSLSKFVCMNWLVLLKLQN